MCVRVRNTFVAERPLLCSLNGSPSISCSHSLSVTVVTNDDGHSMWTHHPPHPHPPPPSRSIQIHPFTRHCVCVCPFVPMTHSNNPPIPVRLQYPELGVCERGQDPTPLLTDLLCPPCNASSDQIRETFGRPSVSQLPKDRVSITPPTSHHPIDTWRPTQAWCCGQARHKQPVPYYLHLVSQPTPPLFFVQHGSSRPFDFFSPAQLPCSLIDRHHVLLPSCIHMAST